MRLRSATLLVLTNYKKKDFCSKLKEVLITLCFLRSAVDTYRVSTNHVDHDKSWDALRGEWCVVMCCCDEREARWPSAKHEAGERSEAERALEGSQSPRSAAEREARGRPSSALWLDPCRNYSALNRP